ncbi:MAG: aspartate 1-decarboxylase [Burkholderiales bacterium]|jgi:aspartate 1-decarboxylase|nr:aspartate 1-decarboxylase [Burkholderiales bacterium]
MQRSMMIGKLHGLRVTGADLHYEGSIALDPEHTEAAGILPHEFVEIWNKTTGARISTYVIPGERGSRCCVLNGAAARTCQIGDELIIAARATVAENELCDFVSRTVVFCAENRVVHQHEHRFMKDARGPWLLSVTADS